jgi:hypothetical protein
MTDADLDAVYTRMCRTMTALGPALTPLFLARLALLAMTHIDHRETAQRLIADAAMDLGEPPPT